MSQVLPLSYYQNEQVVSLAKDLLGKYIFANTGNRLTGGIITETEAYAGVTDKASHAYGGRRTARTEIMYHSGGVSYVYFTYGMHHLFNIVTGKEGVPHAILIRAIFPTEGIETMFQRTGKSKANYNLTNGPAKLTKAMGITREQNGIELTGKIIWLEDRGIVVDDKDVSATPRIGIDYAGEDAKLPYRFVLNYKNYMP